MADPVTISSDNKLPIGWTIKDKGGEVFPDLASMPPGSQVTFESSDTAVVGVHVRPDGLNADLSSDDIGTSTITSQALLPNGSHLPGSPQTLEITVVNAEPGEAVFTVGAPEPE